MMLPALLDYYEPNAYELHHAPYLSFHSENCLYCCIAVLGMSSALPRTGSPGGPGGYGSVGFLRNLYTSHTPALANAMSVKESV